jgi:hypothetical protein
MKMTHATMSDLNLVVAIVCFLLVVLGYILYPTEEQIHFADSKNEIDHVLVNQLNPNAAVHPHKNLLPAEAKQIV